MKEERKEERYGEQTRRRIRKEEGEELKMDEYRKKKEER